MSDLSLLQPEAFAATLIEPLSDVTHNPHAALELDIWPYAEAALAADFDDDTEAWDVLRVFQNGDGTCQHVLIGPLKGSPRLAIVLDLPGDVILGHAILEVGQGAGVLRA